MSPGDPETAVSVEEFCLRTIDVVAPSVAVIKPQASLFESLGWRGWLVLEKVVRHARSAGLLVLLDAKRGDIADTARGYARAYLTAEAPCCVDAMTVNPYLGPESIAPFMEEASKADRGVVVLVRNSNRDSSVYQSLATPEGPFFGVVASSLAPWQEKLPGPVTGWSSLGVTVAATHAGDTERIRTALPHALFLVLGYGAQGGSAQDAVLGFRRGPAGLEGGMVSSSRPILFPAGVENSGARAWEKAVRNAVKQATDELGEAVA